MKLSISVTVSVLVFRLAGQSSSIPAVYEVEGFDLGDGIKYLPNFVLYDVKGLRDNAVNNDLYVEVMGKMNEEDTEKIKRFHKEGPEYWYYFETVDDDYFGAFPGMDKNGNFTLFSDELNYLSDLDEETTEKAYRDARQVRFEFGEKGGL